MHIGVVHISKPNVKFKEEESRTLASKCSIKMFATTGDRGDPIATP